MPGGPQTLPAENRVVWTWGLCSTHVHTQASHACTRMHTHSQTQHSHTQTHIHSSRHIHTYVHLETHRHKHTHTHTHMHTHANTQAHTDTHNDSIGNDRVGIAKQETDGRRQGLSLSLPHSRHPETFPLRPPGICLPGLDFSGSGPRLISSFTYSLVLLQVFSQVAPQDGLNSCCV